MSFSIKPLSETIKRKGIKVIVYGHAKAGKTRLLATMPGKGLVLSAEDGLLSLQPVMEQCSNIDVASIDDADDVRSAYAHLKANPNGYDWVALDSLSEIAEVMLAGGKKGNKDPRQAYGALFDHMLELMREFRKLPIDVCMICKAERVKDEATGRVMTQIMMPGNKVPQAIPYIFDEVLYLFVEETQGPDGAPVYQRWLQTRRGPTVEAGDRSGKLDPLEPADLGALLAKIRA